MAKRGVGSLTVLDQTDFEEGIHQGAEPETKYEGQLWLDTTASPNCLYRWDGSAWQNVGNVDLRDYLTHQEFESRMEITDQAIQSKVSTEVVNALGERVTAAESNVTQTAERIDWMVSGESQASMALTPTMLSVVVRDINLKGKITFNALDVHVQNSMNSAWMWADASKKTIADWTMPNKTTINGGKIETGSITAAQIKVGVGGSNFIKNGNLAYGYTKWNIYNATEKVNVSIPKDLGGGTAVRMTVAGGTYSQFWQAFELLGARKLTLSFIGYAPSRFAVRIYFPGVAEGTTTNVYFEAPATITFKKFVSTVDIPATVAGTGQLIFQFSNDQTTPQTYCIGKVLLQEGDCATGWQSHPSEIKEGLTTIDDTGVMVNHANIGTYTKLSADGLRIYNSSTGVMMGGVYAPNTTIGTVFSANALLDPTWPTGYVVKTGHFRGYASLAFLYNNYRVGAMFAIYYPNSPQRSGLHIIGGQDGGELQLSSEGDLYMSCDGKMHIDTDKDLTIIGTKILIHSSDILVGSVFRPNGSVDLGTAAFKWNNIYARTNVINTSDRREKQDIRKIHEAVSFLMALEPVAFRLNDGSSGREHYGQIAQDVKAAMDAAGIEDFGGYIRAPLEKTEKEQGELSENEVTYGLRYEEFIAPLIATVQEQQRHIAKLEALVQDMEARIALLENGRR